MQMGATRGCVAQFLVAFVSRPPVRRGTAGEGVLED